MFHHVAQKIIYLTPKSGTLLDSAAFGAFLGSFFAFVFGLVLYNVTKRREKWELHHKDAIKIQHLLVRHQSQIKSNVSLLTGALKIYSQMRPTENRSQKLENPLLAHNLLNLDLIKRYNEYYSFVMQLNHNLEGWDRVNERLVVIVINKSTPKTQDKVVKNLVEFTKDQLKKLSELSTRNNELYKYLQEFFKEDQFNLLSIQNKIEE